MLSALTRCLVVIAVALFSFASVAEAKTKTKHHSGAKTAHRAQAQPPNTGKPGSPCAPVQINADPPANETPLDTTSLGPTAPALYSIGAPTDNADRNQPVKRVVMLLHGGGWYTVGQGTLNVTQGVADTWRTAGWEAINVDYQACRRSVASSLAMYDLIRAHFGPDVPICISGDSSGAQLALLIAARRSDVACVIANGAPTDLVRIARQGVHAAFAGTGPEGLATGAVIGAGKAVAAFGKLALKALSPLHNAAKITARVLLANAADDVIIPAAQIASMAHALTAADSSRYVDTDILSPGSIPFAHGTASQAAMDDYYDHVASLVAPFGSGPREPVDAPPPPKDPFKELFSRFFGRA